MPNVLRSGYDRWGYYHIDQFQNVPYKELSEGEKHDYKRKVTTRTMKTVGALALIPALVALALGLKRPRGRA